MLDQETDGRNRLEETGLEQRQAAPFLLRGTRLLISHDVSGYRRGMSRAEALAELRDGKKPSKAALLRCRVRYFADGLVLGSKDFEEKRSWFGPKRKTGARSLPVEGKSLFSFATSRCRPWND